MRDGLPLSFSVLIVREHTLLERQLTLLPAHTEEWMGFRASQLKLLTLMKRSRLGQLQGASYKLPCPISFPSFLLARLERFGCTNLLSSCR
jgi:hypothetical protein